VIKKIRALGIFVVRGGGIKLEYKRREREGWRDGNNVHGIGIIALWKNWSFHFTLL